MPSYNLVSDSSAGSSLPECSLALFLIFCSNTAAESYISHIPDTAHHIVLTDTSTYLFAMGLPFGKPKSSICLPYK